MKFTDFRQRQTRRAGFTPCSLLLVQLLQVVQSFTPVAVNVPVDGSQWIGYDGTWSPISLRVGTPQQAVNLFPSTAGQETLVVGLQGCDDSIECRNLRGGLFAANASSTFQGSGNYDLGLDHRLGLYGGGYYGLDTITVGNEGTVENQVIAVVNSTDYWTGSLGMGTANTTLGSKEATSFLESLVSVPEPKIPSLSYAYTAGASYRDKKVPSSLTLGGFDANRFTPNGVSFSLDSDQKPTLALNSLEFTRSKANTSVLQGEDQVLVTIDSTTPFMWLPEGTATNIGHKLNLVYNETFNLFIYPSDTAYNKIADSDLGFAFGFSNKLGDPVALRLDVPGNAFSAHNLSFGFPGFVGNADTPPVPYFPLRIAKNSTQYTIGRAFLQEAYLIVDYTRNNFSLSQAKFSDDLSIQPNLVDILPGTPDGTGQSQAHTSGTGGADSSNQLSTGVIVGIAVGAVVVLVLVICTLAICLIRRHYAKKVIKLGPHDPLPEPRKGLSRFVFGDYNVAELAAREFAPKGDGFRPESTVEAPGDLYHRRKHVPLTISAGRPGTSSPIGELPTPAFHAATELPSTPVDGPMISPMSPEMAMHPALRYAMPVSPLHVHQPNGPIELPTRNSTCGSDLERMKQAKVEEQELGPQQYTRSRPSPASSLGPDDTADTVSALDSSSVNDRPSSESKPPSDTFSIRADSEKSSISPATDGHPTNRKSHASLRAAAIDGGWHFSEGSTDEDQPGSNSPRSLRSSAGQRRSGGRGQRHSRRGGSDREQEGTGNLPSKPSQQIVVPDNEDSLETRYDSCSETVVSSVGPRSERFLHGFSDHSSSLGPRSERFLHATSDYGSSIAPGQGDVPPLPPPRHPRHFSTFTTTTTTASSFEPRLPIGAARGSGAGFDGRHSGIAWSIGDSADGSSDLADLDLDIDRDTTADDADDDFDDDESMYVIDDRMRVKLDPATLRAAPKAGKMRPSMDEMCHAPMGMGNMF